MINTGNPKHADIFLVTGAVNHQSKEVIRNIYHQLPEPKVVVAVGICAATGGIFRKCYNISGGVDTVIPVGRVCAGVRRPAGSDHRRGGQSVGGARGENTGR